jgi:hypothetical protein
VIRPTEITATEAASNFFQLLDEVDRERRSFLIRRGGKIVAAIGPPEPRSMTVREASRCCAPRPGLTRITRATSTRPVIPCLR